MKVARLRTERRVNPLGLDCSVPRFEWQLLSEECGARQTAYEIEVAETEGALAAGEMVWTSGKVISDRSQFVRYEGPALTSRQCRWWRVRVWDEAGQPTNWSEPAWFEMALLSSDDWQAQWISSAGQEAPKEPEPPALLRRDFRVGEGLVAARLYATAQGAYEAELNGVRVGDLVLAPGWTSYRRQLQYQIHDVTDLLVAGDNAIGVTLGDGWFMSPLFPEPIKHRPLYGNRTALLLQLELRYADGAVQLVTSDDAWRRSRGAICSSQIYAGEKQDARLAQPGWSTAEFDDAAWEGVDVLLPSTSNLIAQSASPLRRMRETAPCSAARSPSGKVLVDFGQNMVGWVRVTSRGEADRMIVLRHGEILDGEGELYTENLRQAAQTCSYICAGGEETFEPHFTFQGFRFVEVDGLDEDEALAGLTGIVVHSDMEPTGTFETSDPLVNQLQSNIVWGMRGNFIDVPLDCPQRDERAGWTGDAQAFAPTAAFNMDVHPFFERWLSDVALEQHADGNVPFVVPDTLGPAGAAGWSDVATIVPMVLYERYGDIELLRRHYPMMRKWVAYQAERAGTDFIWSGDYQFGDWLDFFSATRGVSEGLTSLDLIATAFFAHSTNLVRRAATVLGFKAEAAAYAGSFAAARQAFCARFVSAEGVIGEDTQAAYVFALAFDLLDDNVRPKAAARLAADIRHRGHLTTGFLATPLLLDALTRFGYRDEALMLLFRRDYPSWLYPLSKGATTIWERWGGIKPDGSLADAGMNSFNHYAYGAVGDWMYRHLGGIAADPDQPGFKHFFACPMIVDQLDFVKIGYDGPCGRIVLGWQRKGDHVRVELAVPPNSEATLTLPEACEREIVSGGRSRVDLVSQAITIENGRDLALRLGAGDYVFNWRR